MSKNSQISNIPVPNFLRIEMMSYARKQPDDSICWKLLEITTSENRARRVLAESNYNLRVVECLPGFFSPPRNASEKVHCSPRRIVVDQNF